MRAVTMYQAEDGSIHREKEDAAARDQLIARCVMTEVRLGMKDRPTGTEFGNGGGYVQHPPGTREKLVEWLRSEGAHRDSKGPIGKLLHRAWCMDDRDREWGQPYYAKNPGEGTQKEWQVA